MKPTSVPDRRHVMAQGQTPLVVISSKQFNDRVGALVCWPVSTDAAQESNPFTVRIGNKRQGFGYVMCHQPKTVAWRAEDVTPHPWRRMDDLSFEAALFKLNEVIKVD